MVLRRSAQGGSRLATTAYVYSAVMIALFLIQLGMGGSPMLDIAFLLIALVPVGMIDRNDLYPGDVLFFSLSMYFGGMSLIFKTILLQPLQSNLVAPEMSALYTVLAFASICVAYHLLKYTRRAPNKARAFVVKVFDKRTFVSWLAKTFFVLGFGTQFLASIFRPHMEAGQFEQNAGFGGFGAFYFMMVFGVAAQAGLIWKFKAGILERNILIAMLVGILGISMIQNIKKPMYDAIILMTLCIYAFKIKIRPQAIITLVCVLVFMQTIISPLIHIVRYEGTALSPGERVDATMRILSENDYDFGKISQLYSKQASTMGEYRADSSYYYPSTLNLDRFSLILPTDQVVRTGDPARLDIREQLASSLNQILPAPLVKHTLYVGVDEIAWAYGIRDWGVIGRPVIGIVASSYAVGGLWGILILPGISYGLVFWLIDTFYGRMSGSVPGVAMAAYMSQYAEEDFNAIYMISVREISAILVVLLIFAALYVIVVKRANTKGRPVSLLRRAS